MDPAEEVMLDRPKNDKTIIVHSVLNTKCINVYNISD
jgi:hypothetical protein